MAAPAISDLLKYVDLQMAAEAFLKIDGEVLNGAKLKEALITGNKHASRFTEPQAERIKNHWKVIDQVAENSGFSGTLFECILADPLTGAIEGEQVISFRSTEFIDDSVRDNTSNGVEIANTGFAWGQLRDMQEWYEHLLLSEKLKSQFSVTGYSLGGHLATAFNTMNAGMAERVVTFNGAGIGQTEKDVSLISLVKEFANLSRGKPILATPELEGLYNRVAAVVRAGQAVSFDDLESAESMADLNGSNKTNPDALAQARMLVKSIGSIHTIYEGFKYIGKFAGDERPEQIPLANISQYDLNYQMAVQKVARATVPASKLDSIGRAFDDHGIPFVDEGKQYVKIGKQANQFDVVADTALSMVANSQWHSGVDVRVPIEDQPLYRGGIGLSVAFSNWLLLDAMGYKLLVPGYKTKDFGDTHSLVLLVDSLNVQNMLLNMVPKASRGSAAYFLDTILKDASNLRVANGDLILGEGQGKAEGDVLERVVNALAYLVFGPKNVKEGAGDVKELIGSDRGNLWAKTEETNENGVVVDSGRIALHKLLAEIRKSDLFKAANDGGLKWVLMSTDVFDPKGISELARKDFGVFAALYSLSPFAFKVGDDAIAVRELKKAWGGDSPDGVYAKWERDRELVKGVSQSDPKVSLTYTDEWFAARAEMLVRKDYFNNANIPYTNLPGWEVSANPLAPIQPILIPSTPYNSENIIWEDKDTKLKIQLGEANAKTRYVTFGSEKDDSNLKGGSGNDSLFGGEGDDQLFADAGNDHLEGNSGDDVLKADKGQDTLLGGSGDDQLHGGADGDVLIGSIDDDQLYGDEGNDFLNGGAGADKLNGGADNDILFDQGGSDTSELKGESGNDWLEVKGGSGKTTLDGGSGQDILIGGGEDNTLIGDSGNDLIRGGKGVDDIDGGTEADDIDAGAGNDKIKGGKGSDYLRGGAGNDEYTFEAEFGTDLVADDAGSDSLIFASGKLTQGTYDDNKRAWIAGSMEIRKYESDGSTTLAISQSGDEKNTVYLRNWTPGQFGITLSGSESDHERKKPNVPMKDVNSRAENNYADFIRDDGASGGQGNDILVGKDGNSLLLGGAGNDLIDGRGGDDWIEGGEGTNLIMTGAGKDVVRGGSNKDLVRAGYLFDMFRPTNADGGDAKPSEPEMYWGAGAQYEEWLFNQGDEDTESEFYYTIDPEHGEDIKVPIPYPQFQHFTIDFKTEIGQGVPPSYLYWWNPDDTVASMEPKLDITFKLGSHAWVWRGSKFKQGDQPPGDLIGKPYELKVFLGDAKKVLAGGSNTAGAHIFGGGGDDVLYGANDNDKIEGEGDNDILVGYDGHDELKGGAGADSLSGGAGRDFLDGGSDGDFMIGGLDADVLIGGDGADRLVGDGARLPGGAYPGGLSVDRMGGDLLDGGAGNDTLFGDHGDDILAGGIGDDEIYAGEGDDKLLGEGGRDTLQGGKGADNLDGGGDVDVLFGEEGCDVLQGGTGNDTLYGEEHNDIVDGGADDDQVSGGGGSDQVRGGAGNDLVIGDGPGAASGADVLEGGTGDDLLSGGGMGDTYVFSKGDGRDVIQDDGSDGARNRIFFKLASNEVYRVKAEGKDLVIEYGDGDSVRVPGFYGSNEFGLGYEGDGAAMIDVGEARARVAEIHFEDGVVWGIDEILAMAPAPADLPVDPYAQMDAIYFVDALLSRDEVRAAGKHELSFSFGAQPGAQNAFAYTDEQKQAVREALTRFSAVLDLRFVEQADGTVADLNFFLDDLTSKDMGAYSGYASPETGEIHLNSRLYAEQRKDELGAYSTPGSIAVGSAGFEVLLHEIGHALGLKHPFEPPVLPNSENTTANTVMSYTRSGAPATQLAAFDIAALQFHYGVPTQLNAGDNVIRFGERWLQDAGGTDLFDASAETLAVSVDLTPGSWVYRGTKADSILADNQAFIGFGSVIESASGGAGNDTLTGNELANMLQGGIGNDVLDGGMGNDTLVGGLGSDTFVWKPVAGADIVRDRDVNADIDTLRIVGVTSGNALKFTVEGTSLLIRHVQTGATLLIDAQFAYQGVECIELDGGFKYSRDDIYLKAHPATDPGDPGDPGSGTPQPVVPTEGNDFLEGEVGNDRIDGLGGNDKLYGVDGADTLIGGAGTDTLYGGAGNDSLNGELIYGEAGDDHLDGAVADGGTGNDTLVGTAATTLIGGEGSDTYDLRNRTNRDEVLVLRETVDAPGEMDTLLLGDGFDRDNLTRLRVSLKSSATLGGADHLVISAERADGTGVWIEVENALREGGTTHGIESVQLADGTVLSLAQLRERAQGYVNDNRNEWSGTSGSDSVNMGAGDDVARGRGGNDTLVGGLGNDTLEGDGGNDTYAFGAGSGFDQVSDTDGTDTVKFLDVTADKIELYRDGEDLWIYRSDDQSQILVKRQFEAGLAGSSANAAIERIEFADGNAWNAADMLARLSATPSEYLNFTYSDAGNGNDVVVGNKGRNRMVSSYGADTLKGGAGDDVYVLDTLTGFSSSNSTTDDVVIENAGEGLDTVLSSAAVSTLPENVENLILAPTNYGSYDGNFRFVLNGNGLNNYIEIDASQLLFRKHDRAVQIDGGLGADTMVGAQLSDIYVVDNVGDVVIDSHVGDDDIVRSSISYTLGGKLENLELTGHIAKQGTGNALANRLSSHQSSGADTLTGGAGDDHYVVGAGDTVIEFADGGIDTMESAGSFTLAAHVEIGLLSNGGTLTGSERADKLMSSKYGKLLGGMGADTLTGGADATLDGGAGDDELHAKDRLDIV